MLLNDLYTISRFTSEEGAIEASLEIHAGHRIFEGHFPGQPVTPGVCMMQMIQEIAEKAVGCRLQLLTADDMKFLAIIDPVRNNKVEARLKIMAVDEDQLHVVASLFKDELVHFKFKGSFRKPVSPSSAS